MAAEAFKVFNNAKGHLGKGNITLNSGNFRLILIKSNGTPLSVGISADTWTSLQTDGVSGLVSAGNYSASGTLLASPAWTQSGTKWMFDATNWSLSANGVDHLSIYAALIKQSTGDRPLAYASLSTASINVSDGNKLIITFNTSGIFELD